MAAPEETGISAPERLSSQKGLDFYFLGGRFPLKIIILELELRGSKSPKTLAAYFLHDDFPQHLAHIYQFGLKQSDVQKHIAKKVPGGVTMRSE